MRVIDEQGQLVKTDGELSDDEKIFTMQQTVDDLKAFVRNNTGSRFKDTRDKRQKAIVQIELINRDINRLKLKINREREA